MIDTNELRAVWCDDETSHLVTDTEALYWSDSVAVAVLCDEINRLREQLREITDAAAWAQNEMSHSTDEDGCCYRSCQSCKAIKQNPLWNKWWNDGYDPIDAVLTKLANQSEAANESNTEGNSDEC